MNHISSHIAKRMMLINLCTVVLIMIHGVESVSLKQSQKVLVKQKGKSVSFKCEVTGLGSGGYVHWYHKKEGETLKRLLYISHSGIATSDAKEFVSEKVGNSYGIKLKTTTDDHAGIYYCASWEGSRKVFGSGTRLYVTDPKSDTVKTPKLTGYLPSKKSPDNHGKQTMLCHASDMFPDLVTFKWQEKSGGGEWTDASEENVVEQRKESKPVTVTSMMIVDKNMALNKDFKCIVTHEGITGDPQILEMKEENSKPAKESEGDDQNTVACTPSAEEPLTKQISGDSEQIPSMFLFVYAYGVLLMKNGLFFSVVSIFLLKRKAGRKDKSSET